MAPVKHRGSIHTFPNPVRPSKVSAATSSLLLQPPQLQSNQTEVFIMWAVGTALVWWCLFFLLCRRKLWPDLNQTVKSFSILNWLNAFKMEKGSGQNIMWKKNVLIFLLLTGETWTCWTAGKTCKYTDNSRKVCFCDNFKGDERLNSYFLSINTPSY